MTYAITSTKTLRTRKDGDIAFFDGTVGDHKIRIQTQIGHPLRVRIDDGALVPQTAEAERLLSEMVRDAAAEAERRAALIARKRAEAPAQLEAIFAEATKNLSPAQMEAKAPLIRAWRAQAAQHVAVFMNYPTEWDSLADSVRKVDQSMDHHLDPAVRRLLRGR